MRKLLLLLLLLCGTLHSQITIAGYVYDETENKPLEGAYVYIDGTTFSASTNDKGFFRLVLREKYNAPLIISFVGFETLRIEDPYQYEGKPFKAMLREDVTMLDEVVIDTKPPFTRKQMLAVFRKEFLGRSRAGSSCTIENEDDVYLYYDQGTNSLRARASKPLRIKNKRLEYNVMFELKAFEVSYNYLSLDDNNMVRSFYAGTSAFNDVSKKGSADKKRKAAYVGSATHLMRTFLNDDWKEQKFTLYIDKVPTDPHECFIYADSSGYRKVTLNKQFMDDTNPIKITGLQPKGRPVANYSKRDFIILRDMDTRTQTTLNFYRDTFYIDKNGLFWPVDAFLFRGYMGSLKAGDLLPADYEYVP